MTDTELFEKKMVALRYNYKTLSKELGISDRALALKVNNTNEFKASEIIKLRNILKLTAKEVSFIFFKN